MNGIRILLVWICIISSRAYAGTNNPDDGSSASMKEIMGSDVQGVLHDAGAIFGAPLHFNTTQWLLTGSVVAGTALFFLADKPVRSLAMRNHSTFGDALFGVGREYGREVYGLSLSAGLYAGGLMFRSEGVRETGLMVFESIAMAGIITSVVKSALGRSRPYVDEGPFRYRGFQFKTATTSLPSGHTTVAFATSSVLAGRIKNTYASIGLYTFAAVTALSRVYHDAHWISDNILAAAIGTCVGTALVRLHDEENSSPFIRVVPGGLGIRLEAIIG